MIHIGSLLNAFFENKRTRRAALAKLMNINLANLMKMEKKESIQTKRLQELCTHLKHNFFMDIAQQLPPEYTTNKNIFEEKDRQIADLQKQLDRLTIENDVLRELKR